MAASHLVRVVRRFDILVFLRAVDVESALEL